MSRLQKKPPAHKRGHPTLHNMNFFYFCWSFLSSWILIRIPTQITDPDSDPVVRLNTDPIRIRIPDSDPNPQHCFIDVGSEILDPGWVKKQDPGSGINIPDPQHCKKAVLKSWNLGYFVNFRQFPCSCIRIRIPNADPDLGKPTVNSNPDHHTGLKANFVTGQLLHVHRRGVPVTHCTPSPTCQNHPGKFGLHSTD